MDSRLTVTALGIASSILLAGGATAQITQENLGVFKYAIDGGTPVSVNVDGVQLLNGNSKYAHSVFPVPGLELSFVCVLDDISNPTAWAATQFKCVNTSGVPRGVEAWIEFPLCPAVPGGTKIGGTLTVLLLTDANGGSVSCLPGANSAWQLMIGGEAAHSMYWCPFQLASSGSGSIQNNSQFGMPIPALNGPNSAPTLGSRHRFALTNGETVTFTTNVVVQSMGALSPCASDVNGDGMIDAMDLTEILGRWGASDSKGCNTADVNGDGIVDGNDLAAVLGTWGPCSQ
ncbi:MAG: hypothetical protein KF724_01800 [Phycisphaeraceae bacterium]|nr:hypothetical protein [Phycisphaeraceae bacterium]